ncbi:acyl-CoA thioesterase [Effusibacillus pohliae]|uniref:acyl-CoA thioesterase n=1 Tax=Effusibacillus pohliae TaxID=232270 RepID=UPI00037EF2CE|nr:thioesterase family protein [Effusibacillus pohliae]
MTHNWSETELRVRYSETDAMQVVHHANYLSWFEVGRTEMMRRAGIPYRQFEDRGILLPVIEARIFFLASARYDDELVVRTRLAEARVKVRFEYEIARKSDRQILARGYTVHAWVNRQMKPIQLRKLAPELEQAMQAYLSAEGESQA